MDFGILRRSQGWRHGSRQLGMGCPGFPMNESHGISDHKVQVAQIHILACIIEPESKSNRQSRASCRYLFVRTTDMFEMVREDIHQLELQALLTPLLTDLRGADTTFFSGTIKRVKDRHASQVGVTKRSAIRVEIVISWINDDF